MIINKEWGTTECILKTPFVEAHKIIVNPNMKCSLHKHERKNNSFIVISGSLYIYIGQDCFQIDQGAFFNIPYGMQHQFQAGKDGAAAVELYYPAELSEDIVRYNAMDAERLS